MWLWLEWEGMVIVNLFSKCCKILWCFVEEVDIKYQKPLEIQFSVTFLIVSFWEGWISTEIELKCRKRGNLFIEISQLVIFSVFLYYLYMFVWWCNFWYKYFYTYIRIVFLWSLMEMLIDFHLVLDLDQLRILNLSLMHGQFIVMKDQMCV